MNNKIGKREPVQKHNGDKLGYAIVYCSLDTNIDNSGVGINYDVDTCVRSNNKKCNKKQKPIMT